MKIVIAPDSFKGSLTAKQVSDAIERGIKKVNNHIHIESIPMADGGEGTVQSLVDATKGRIVNVQVKDPLMRSIEAFYGILGDGETAVIEMSAASGLPLLKEEERNPLKTTTYGTGELFMHAYNEGCRNFIIGIGGSATNDGGIGMMMALGGRFFDSYDQEIGIGGEALISLESMDLESIHEIANKCNIVVACDVDNPLCGERGAARIFGPQKGATKEMVEILDRNLQHLADKVEKYLGTSIIDVPGAGAAGGLGGGMMAFLKANLKRGIDIVIETTALEEKIKDADLVITGEGSIDYQTQYGKTPYGVAKLAKKYSIPVIALAGGIGKEAEVLYDKGFDSIFSIVDKPMTLDEAMENGEELIEKAAERVFRTFMIGSK